MDPVIAAIWRAAEHLARVTDPKEALPEALEQLRSALDAPLVSFHSGPVSEDGDWPCRLEGCALEPGRELPPALRAATMQPFGGDAESRELLRAGRELLFVAEGDGPPLPEILQTFGLPSLIAVPVRSETHLAGLLTCGGRGADVRPGEQTQALRFIANLLGGLWQRRQDLGSYRRSEDRRRRVEKAAAEYIWECDADGVITYISDRAEAVLGYPPEEIVGRTPFDFMPAERAAQSRLAFLEAVRRKVAFRDVVGRALHRDGHLLWTLTSGLPRLDERGELLGYTGTTGDISERRHAEATLQASEARYRSLVESQQDLITRWDRDYRFTFANASFCSYFHMDLDAVLNRPVAEVVPADRSERVDRLVRSLSKPPYGVAMEDPAPDGSEERLLSWEAFPILDERGEVIEYQAVGRDITKAHRAQQDVARRDRILEAVSQAAERILGTEEWEETLSYVLDQLGRATEVTRLLLLRARREDARRVRLQLRKIWLAEGAADPPPWPDDLVVDSADGDRDLAAHARRDRAVVLTCAEAPSPLRELLESRGTHSILAVPILLEDEWWGSLVLPSLGGPRRWSGSEVEALRISARLIAAAIRWRRIRRALRESEARYRSLVEGASQPILILDKEGRFLFANRFACESVRLKPEEIRQKRIWDIFPADRADAHLAVVQQALSSGRPTGSTSPTVIQGRERWFSSRVQPLLDVGDGREAALVILQDVTDEKQNERRVLEYQGQLQELTSELALAEQRERRRIAAELHDRIGQALAITRIKLGGVRQSLAGDAREAGLVEAIRLVEQSIQDTRTLTFELSPPVLYELGLEPALEWLVERVHQRDGLEVDFRGDHQEVPLPPEMLGFVFQSTQELLVNVVKHARAQTVRMRKYRKDHRLAIEVADDGVGYDPSRLIRTDGGFGLFSIRERLRHLGGSLKVESRPGKGTRCTIWVPLEETEAPSKGDLKS